MAVAVTTANVKQSSDVDGNTTHTLAACTIQSGEAALVIVLLRDSGQDVSSVTYDGSATGVALLTGGQPAAQHGVGIAVYSITGVTGSNANIVVTYGAGPSASHVWFVPLSGQHAVTPFGTLVFDGVDGSSLTSSSVTGETDGLFVSGIYTRAAAASFAPGTGVTEIGSEINEAGFGSSSSVGTKAGAASATVAWSWSGAQGTFMVVVPVLPAEAANEYTLTAEQGSYSLAGSAALVDLSLTAAQGSYALTGQAASLLSGLKLVAEFGQYALSGQASPLHYSAEVVLDTTGQTPAGRAQRKHYFVEIDGRHFPVESPGHARALIERAKALAAEAAAKKAASVVASRPLSRKVRPVKVAAPVIHTNAPIDLAPIQRDLNAIYAAAARDAEIRLYLALQALEDDDEDVLLLM